MVSEQVLGTCTHWGDLGEGRLSGYKGSSESLRRACGRFVGNLPNADCSGWIVGHSDITLFLGLLRIGGNTLGVRFSCIAIWKDSMERWMNETQSPLLIPTR